MYKKDKIGMIEQVIKFAKWIRIFYAVGFVIYGIMVIFIAGLMLTILSQIQPALAIFLGVLIIALVILGFALQIYFFKYFGKVAKQTRNGIYTSAKPALVNLIFNGISLFRSLREIPEDGLLGIIGILITLFVSYLVYGVYQGLKAIEDNHYFDNAVSQPTMNNSVVTQQDDTWIKED